MNRLRQIREARGIDPHKLAALIGKSSPWYFDLEADREDWADEISTRDLQKLCKALGVAPSFLLCTDGDFIPRSEMIAERLRQRLKETGLSVEEISTKIGWDVQPILADPSKLGDFHAVGFQAVCSEVGVDWLSLLDQIEF